MLFLMSFKLEPHFVTGSTKSLVFACWSAPVHSQAATKFGLAFQDSSPPLKIDQSENGCEIHLGDSLWNTFQLFWKKERVVKKNCVNSVNVSGMS